MKHKILIEIEYDTEDVPMDFNPYREEWDYVLRMGGFPAWDAKLIKDGIEHDPR